MYRPPPLPQSVQCVFTNDNGQRVTITIDNRWVVPDNPALSLKYGSHINVEYVSNNRVAMYLYKYNYKGSTLVAFPPYV